MEILVCERSQHDYNSYQYTTPLRTYSPSFQPRGRHGAYQEADKNMQQ
jgi:hypothetical protein